MMVLDTDIVYIRDTLDIVTTTQESMEHTVEDLRLRIEEMQSAINNMLEFLVEAKSLMDNSPALKLRRALSGKRPVV
jgi:hypothetical protein